MKQLIAFAALAAVTAPVWAASRTVTLSVPSMRCSMCPITVKEALSKVPAVSKIAVSLAKKDAVVTFNARKTTVGTLTKATRDAGYPSTIEP
ncbi:MAG: mercury resistance system periplasmic binding protein MerP [Pseudomonadota bacterium]|jgi:mercuric ion binding protein|nr:mercury resistance system periplasmic binding protein MerP [Pseudomonadota bacterium]